MKIDHLYSTVIAQAIVRGEPRGTSYLGLPKNRATAFASLREDMPAAPVFVVPFEDWAAAVGISPDEPVLPATLPELPPLPHETIFVEYRDGDGDPCRVATFPSREPGDHEGHLIGYLIHEFKEGEQWGIVAVSTFRSADGQTRLDAFEYGLDADGAVIYDEGDRMLTTAPAELDGLAGFAYTLAPVMSVHVIDAIGSKLIDGELPRARRREYERRHRATHPHVYIVRIGGERMPSLTTGTGARLTVRFLVRGHWRTLPGKRVWVRPHVKGPAGAPWKGKPVYVRADVPAGNPTTSA